VFFRIFGLSSLLLFSMHFRRVKDGVGEGARGQAGIVAGYIFIIFRLRKILPTHTPTPKKNERDCERNNWQRVTTASTSAAQSAAFGPKKYTQQQKVQKMSEIYKVQKKEQQQQQQKVNACTGHCDCYCCRAAIF